MIRNELLSIDFLKEKSISINASYSLIFLYSNKKTLSYRNKKTKLLILTPFEETVVDNPIQNLITCVTLKLDYLSSYIDSETILKLETKEFKKNFISGFELYFERFLELIIDSNDPFRQLTVSTIFINNLISNIDKDVKRLTMYHSNVRNLIEIQKYIYEHFNKNISLTSLSEHFNYSPAYLSRVFKQEIGVGFSEYLKNIKLNNATKQLLNSNQSITEIALTNGFGSSSSFNRIFKDEYNITPSDYRQLHQHNISEDTDFYDESKNVVLDEIRSKKQRISKNIDVTSRLMNKFSPYNQLINIPSFEFLNSSLNISKLNDAKESIKCSVVRFELNFYDFITSKDIQQSVSNAIETLSLNGLIPFISFDLSSTKISNQIDADVISQKLIRFVINEIKKYNLDQFSKWYFEFKFFDLSNNSLNNYYRSIVKTFVDFLDLAMEKNNVIIHIGNLHELVFPQDYSLVEEINIKYISFDLYIDLLNEDILDLSTISHKINASLCNLQNYFDKDFKFIVSNFDISKKEIQTYNDKISKACYYIEFLTLVYPLFEMIGISRIFDEPNENYQSLLYGGNGIFTVNGLHKNIAHSLIFLRKLGSNIIYMDKGLLIAKKSFSDYVMIASNFTNLLFDYDYFKDSTQENAYFGFENLNKTFSVQLKNINDGSYKIKKYHSKIDQKQLDTILSDFGNVTNLQDDEMLYLQVESRPELSFLKLQSNNSILNIDVDLKPNEFTMIYIYYQY